jgi:pSer/pThr/pTyr-binding forkhead associated (FHA) protein
MALLKHRATGERYSLSSSYIVGRAPASNLELTNRLASSTHAEIMWNGSAWELRDLGSRNGTFIGTRRLQSGERVTLRRDVRIAFGDAEDPYELEDDGPPNTVATTDDGRREESEDGFLILPHPEQPVFTIFDEGSGLWVAESNDGARRRVSDGDVLHIDGQLWRIELPRILELTWKPGAAQMSLHGATMRFEVSSDEERVDVSLIQDNLVVKLPSRVHYFLLLALARARLRDQEQAEVSDAEVGWMYVEELLDMLALPEPGLNVQICRARKDLVRAKVLGATDLIERQPMVRRLRLGVEKLEISKI